MYSRGGAAVPGPLLDLGQLVDEEDALSLGLPARLHDPRGGRALPELLHKQVVVRRQHEGHRDEVWRRRGDKELRRRGDEEMRRGGD